MTGNRGEKGDEPGTRVVCRDILIECEVLNTVSSAEAASPVSISGKLSLKATLPDSQGGAVATEQEAAAAAGTKTFTGVFVVPEGLPEGDANITITLSTGKSGTVKFSKRYVLELD